jgi:predicted  nucleic acid-binding Zn-ribbon protein
MNPIVPHVCGDCRHRDIRREGHLMWQCMVCGKASKFPNAQESVMPNAEMTRHAARELARDQHNQPQANGTLPASDQGGERVDGETYLRALVICSGALACLVVFGGAMYFWARAQ